MQRLAILYDASQAVLSTFDFDEVMQQILAILRDYFQVTHSAVLLLDEETRELVPRILLGWPDEARMRSFRLGQGIAGHAAQSQRPVYSPQVSNDQRYLESLPGIRSELAIPLTVQNTVMGVLDCQSHHENYFDQETIDLLTLFSTQASIALSNARLHALERQRAAQMEVINAIARQTAAVTDLNQLLQRSSELLVQAFGADHVAVLLLEENRLVLRAHHGRLTARMPDGSDMPATAGLCGRALASAVPVLVNDVSSDPDYVAGIAGVAAELCLPLISFGQPLGALSLASAKKGAFRPSDIEALESVADIVAGAIQNAIYLERVRQLAYRDGLTGIFNRRFFELRVLEELERARRYQLALSVLLIDIDAFKALNDEFGHLLGDEALRQLSTLLVQQLRRADVVCRFGGDEFAILLPETTCDHAEVVAEKLRHAVAALEVAGVPRPVTISAGVACFPKHGSDRDQLMKAADDALYCAKQAGRNCVLMAKPRSS